MDFLNYWDTRIDANERFFNNYPHIANFAFSECQELWDRMSADYAALEARHNTLVEAVRILQKLDMGRGRSLTVVEVGLLIDARAEVNRLLLGES